MANICEIVDKKMTRKRRYADTVLDSNSIKKRLRGYRCQTTLMDLNDHCLLLIFEHLKEIDVCHIQNVCGRFALLAESAFLAIHRRSPVKNIFQLGYSRLEIRRVLYKFEHLLDRTKARFSLEENFLLIDSKLRRAIHSAEQFKEFVANYKLMIDGATASRGVPKKA